jgi:hypothetical protein
MAKQFKEGDLIQYKDSELQRKNEKENPTPFSVFSSNLKDLYNSGLPMDCWDEIVEVQNSNGEVFDEVEAADLVGL